MQVRDMNCRMNVVNMLISKAGELLTCGIDTSGLTHVSSGKKKFLRTT